MLVTIATGNEFMCLKGEPSHENLEFASQKKKKEKKMMTTMF